MRFSCASRLLAEMNFGAVVSDYIDSHGVCLIYEGGEFQRFACSRSDCCKQTEQTRGCLSAPRTELRRLLRSLKPKASPAECMQKYCVICAESMDPFINAVHMQSFSAKNLMSEL